MEYIAFDAHKHYTLASVATPEGQLVREERIEHERGALREFLERCEPGIAGGRRDDRQLVLDRRRDRGGGLSAQVGTRSQSEADDGGDQQDG